VRVNENKKAIELIQIEITNVTVDDKNVFLG